MPASSTAQTGLTESGHLWLQPRSLILYGGWLSWLMWLMPRATDRGELWTVANRERTPNSNICRIFFTSIVCKVLRSLDILDENPMRVYINFTFVSPLQVFEVFEWESLWTSQSLTLDNIIGRCFWLGISIGTKLIKWYELVRFLLKF